MCDRPFDRESKAMSAPSGDQLGLPVNGPSNDVNLTRPLPSLREIQISCEPERYDWKAISLPSGEYWAAESFSVDESSEVASTWEDLRSIRVIFQLAEP